MMAIICTLLGLWCQPVVVEQWAIYVSCIPDAPCFKMVKEAKAGHLRSAVLWDSKEECWAQMGEGGSGVFNGISHNRVCASFEPTPGDAMMNRFAKSY